MPDLLIRNVDDDTLRSIDERAQRLGLSRAEFLRREVGRIGRRAVPETGRVDLAFAAEVFVDLADDSVMERAWS